MYTVASARQSCVYCYIVFLDALDFFIFDKNSRLNGVVMSGFADNNHLMFRGNSIATKAMETYMKLVGDKVCILCNLYHFSIQQLSLENVRG